MLAVDPPLAVNRPVSLPALLISRECRQARQQARHQCILLVLTLVVPGSVKDNALTRRIFNLGWQALCQRLSEQGWPCLQAAILALPTGCEGYLALQADAWRVKIAPYSWKCASRLADCGISMCSPGRGAFCHGVIGVCQSAAACCAASQQGLRPSATPC